AVLAKAAAGTGPVAAGKVFVVGGGLHQLVKVGIEILAVHTLVMRPGNEMPQVTDHVVGEEWLAVFVPIESPGIGGAVGDDFENFSDRVITPDRAVEENTIFVGRAGLADERVLENAVTAIKPAVRSPGE